MGESRADWDVVVVGSGFGGSVAALRATEKGYRVLVVEAGRRWRDEDFPRTNWNPRNALWAPALGMYGTWRMTLLEHSLVLSAAGVGGGSLVYANTLYRPTDTFYADPQWKHITDWEAELAPYFDQATRMLGVTENPMVTPADAAMRQVAEEMGRADTFRLTPVGVLFGEREGAPLGDPFFGGVGPERHACRFCGGCMVGCRFGAKNTMTKNYLFLAEQAGARVAPLTTVDVVRPLASGGYALELARSNGRGSAARKTITAEQVVISTGALGTQKLLQRMKADGYLPALSDHLGRQFRTNSEEVLGITRSPFASGEDHSRGVAITSSFFPDERTHVEPVRFSKGSNLFALLYTLLVDGDAPGEEPRPRWRRYLDELAARPGAAMHPVYAGGWSERGFAVLVMQDVDNALTLRLERRPGGRVALRTSHGDHEPPPRWVPSGHEAARRLADLLGGEAMGPWTDIVDIPWTAHILGGAVIGDSPQRGTVDPWQRVYGYPGLHVIDGSAVSANLGVNPSLTITAQAERAMSFWPNKGQDDSRPPVGSDYVLLAPLPPKNPVVPEDAPGALRLPVSL